MVEELTTVQTVKNKLIYKEGFMSKIYKIENNKLLSTKTFIIYSDIHYYKNMNLNYLYKELSKLTTDSPNYILLLGDLIDDPNISSKELPPLRDYLLKLSKITKIITILGNHDIPINYKNISNENSKYLNMLRNIPNLHLLENTSYQDNQIYFYGTKYQGTYYKHKEPLPIWLSTVKNITFPDDTLNIILEHSPNNIFNPHNFTSIPSLKKTDIVLSGHNHFGCIPSYLNPIIPGNIGLIGAGNNLFPKYSRGKIQITPNTTGIICPPITTFSNEKGIFKLANIFYPPQNIKLKILRKK